MTQVSIFDKSDRPFDAEGMERHIARALTVKAPSGLVENAWYQAIRRVFDPQLVAAGNIPARPCLFVGNHALFALDGWQLFYFRGNAWTNPMSSAGTPSPTATLPDGVRLVLDLPGGQALAGRITSDWVRPTLSPAEPQT